MFSRPASPGEDFDATYRAVGGAALSAEAVAHCVGAAVAGFLADYTNPALVDDFPSLRETLAKHSTPSRHEARLLELVIARHEVGVVPEWAAQVLLTLAGSHRMGLVSNLECQVFSSDTRSIKPSPRLLLQALGMLDLPPQDVLFVGDSLERDIAPAKALGMATCWVTACGGGADVADFCIPSIAALTAVPTPARG
jgi:putative hydrolase of the HAD superfamily